MNIHLGYELGTGREIGVPLRHTAVTGQTQASGKTTTLEALIHRSGRRAVAFLTKRGEGAFQTSTPVPPYFSEATDWEYVKGMLESQARTKLKFETSWIIEVSKGTKTLADVKHNVEVALRGIPNPNPKKRKGKEWMRRPASGLSQGVYTVLDAYLDKLLPQIEKLKYERTLDLKPGLNVMDLTAYSLEMQGLVVRSVLQWVYERERNVIVIIPEAWELLPQDRGSPVRLAAETYIRKGAVLGNYLWLDSQDIAGVNKAILRQVGVWIIGVQREANEVMRTLKQFISQPARPKPDDLMTLGKGQFLVAYDISQYRAYVQPRWMNQVHARAIATGDETIESAAAVYRDYLEQFKTARAKESRESSMERTPEQSGREIVRSHEAPAPVASRSPDTLEGSREDMLHQRPEPETASAPTPSFRDDVYDDPRYGPIPLLPLQKEKTTMPPMPTVPETFDTEKLYMYIRARILADPHVLAVLAQPLEVRVIDQLKVLEMDGDTLPGQVATLIHEGFFTQPKKGYAVWQELVERRRKKFAKPSVYDALDNAARMGFLVREDGAYSPVAGMKITRRTA